MSPLASPATTETSVPRNRHVVGDKTPAGSAKVHAAPNLVAPALRVTHSLGDDQARCDARTTTVVVEGQTPAATDNDGAASKPRPLSLLDPTLLLLADVLDDLESVRIANENRVRQLTRSEVDSDGNMRGFELDLSTPEVAALQATVDGIAALEHGATLQLKRAMRKHPLGPWLKAANGIGEKQGARLLAAIGDPYWNDLHNRPRTVSELWAYTGYHVLPVKGHGFGDTQIAAALDGVNLPAADQPSRETHGTPVSGGNQTSGTDEHRTPDTHGSGVVGVAAKRARGQKANWSATAKMRAYLVAEACMKCRTSPYRAVYDAGRVKYADSAHGAPCVRCGPKNKPAEVGTPISLGHQHARALRLVAKAVLKDLWIESKRLHEEHQA